MKRRTVLAGVAGLTTVSLSGCATEMSQEPEESNMYGLIAKITAVDGKRNELSAILLEGLRGMPGNLSYIVAKDPNSANDLWITEAWADKQAHERSLNLPSVQNAIQAGRPLIAGMERIVETQPIGGNGL